MAGIQAAGGNGKNGIADKGTEGSNAFKIRTGDQQALDDLTEESVRHAKTGNPISKEEGGILE